MINKQDNNQDQVKQTPSAIDTAKMAVACHLRIREKETDKELVNKRG